ncbi:MAG: hypothetical protein Q9166_001874 [cf. Caloplaca sp. 2 TL-2023]
MSGGTRSIPNFHQERHSTQMTLDEFENVRPVVKQLQSLRPRRTPGATSRSLLSESQAPLRSGEGYSTVSSRTKEPFSYGSRNDRIADAGVIKSVTQSTTTPPALDELEAKRRELLQTFDWVGLETMKPVKMKFAEAEDRDQIGKRRLMKGNYNIANHVVHQNRRPVIDAHEKLDMLRAHSSKLSSPDKISIHIGSTHRGSPTSQRSLNSSNGGNNLHTPMSECMLFEDQSLAPAVKRGSVLTQGIIHGSINSSDEMLFDRERSDVVSQPFNEPAVVNEGLGRQPSHNRTCVMACGAGLPTTYTISSSSETEHSSGHQASEVESDEHHARRRTSSANSRFQYPRDPAVRGAFKFARLDPGDTLGDIKETSYVQLEHRDNKESWLERQRIPLRDDQNIRNRQMSQSSTPDHGAKDNGCPSAQATTQTFLDFSPLAGTFRGVPVKKLKNENSDNQTSETQYRDLIQPQSVEAQQRRSTEPLKSQGDLGTQFSHQSTQERGTPAGAPSKATSTALPLAPFTPNRLPEPQTVPQAPIDPTPEEDELLWRTFVFGTDDPTNDWTFEDPIPKPKPKPPPKPHSSSPLPPAFNDMNESPRLTTQPSVLVEASSSSSPTKAREIHTTSSPSHPSSPHKTQHSIQAQASSSSPTPNQPTRTEIQSTTSSDPLSFSPSRLLHPPVTFRKPSRYTGDSQESIAPVRLGLRRKRRGNDGDEDGEYREGERGKSRKVSEREWGGGHVEGWEGDEIVDE